MEEAAEERLYRKAPTLMGQCGEEEAGILESAYLSCASLLTTLDVSVSAIHRGAGATSLRRRRRRAASR